jgi:hypothetical protein
VLPSTKSGRKCLRMTIIFGIDNPLEVFSEKNYGFESVDKNLYVYPNFSYKISNIILFPWEKIRRNVKK